MEAPKYIPYYRVSTQRQGQSGLGLEAQKRIVLEYVASSRGTCVHEGFVEVESGKKAKNRPKLQEALALARSKKNRAILIVAKLDRLARQASFVAALLDSGVEFIACDFPQANRFVIQIMSAVAEYEATLISTRTKAALAALKARGVRLGNPQRLRDSGQAKRNRDAAVAEAQRLRPVLDALRADGCATHRRLTRELNRRGYLTARGGRWHPTQVSRVMERLAARTSTQHSGLSTQD